MATEDTELAEIKITALEAQQRALQMVKDGFTPEQIAEALGYSVSVINNFTNISVDIGSSEEIIQESLRTIVSLIPIAESQYRERPTTTNAYALTSFIESARSLIDQSYTLKSKEDVYKNIVAKILQPFCREMITSMISEVGVLNSTTKTEEDLKMFSTNLGKKFQEAYRKTTEDLSNVLGVSSDARAKILSGTESESL